MTSVHTSPDFGHEPDDPGQAALDALIAILGDTNPHHLVAIGAGGDVAGETFLAGGGRIFELDWLHENDGRFNLYYHLQRLRGIPASGKAAKRDVACFDYAAVDLDPPAAQVDMTGWRSRKVEELMDSGAPPSFVVNSGNGLHAMWKLADPLKIEGSEDIERAEAVNRLLASRFAADAGTWSIDRIWRVPFTTNVPTPKKMQAGREAVRGGLVS